MYCTKCGVVIDDKVNYCPACGQPTIHCAAAPRPYPKLSRPREDRKIGGVCAGFARYFGIDVTLMRLIFVILAIWPIGLGVIAYLVAWIVMPQDPLLLPAPAHSEPSHA